MISAVENHIKEIARAMRSTMLTTECGEFALALMHAAKPLDDAAEREHCRASFERDMRPLSGVQPMHVEWLMRERAQAHAGGYEAGCEAGSTAQANADQALARIATDNYAKLTSQLAAAQAELEEATHFGGYAVNVELQTKLNAAQAEIEQCRHFHSNTLADQREAETKLSAAQAEIERLRVVYARQCGENAALKTKLAEQAEMLDRDCTIKTKLTNLRAAAERYLLAYHEDEYPEDLAQLSPDDAMNVLIDQLCGAAEASR